MFNLLKSDVKFDKEYTVKEFIEEMMQTRVGDWGYINIYDNAKRIEQLEYDTAGYYVASDNEDHKIKKAYAVRRGSRTDYNICIEYQKQKPNKVANLTKEHICSCKFKTIEEAIQDMNDRLKKGLIESYIVKGERK